MEGQLLMEEGYMLCKWTQMDLLIDRVAVGG